MTGAVRAFTASDRDDVRSMADRLAVGVASWRDAGRVTDAVRGWVDTSIMAATEKDGAMFVADVSGMVAGFVSVTQQTHWTGEVDGYIGSGGSRVPRYRSSSCRCR